VPPCEHSENRNLGEDFVGELLADGTFDFTVTDEADAVEGTEVTDYYAMIVVPENFSSDVSSATTTEKETTSIIYSPNEKENYLACQIQIMDDNKKFFLSEFIAYDATRMILAWRNNPEY
jgi:YhgE/Pip-like protein